MNATDCTDAVAVLCENQGATAQTMRGYLESQNLAHTHWYDPLNLDDLDEAVCRRRIRRVVFPQLSTLLAGIWNGRITFEHWLSSGVRLDFVSPPAAEPVTLTRLIFESWQCWHRRHRRRQSIAGAVLSAIMVATAFLSLSIGRTW